MIDGFFAYEEKNPLLLFPINGADTHDLQQKIIKCNVKSREYDWKAPLEISSSQALMVRQYGKLLLFAPFDSRDSPLMVEELMSKIIEVLESYLKKTLTPSVIVDKKADIVLVLSEMIDVGFPRITEPNIIAHLLSKEGILTQLLAQATSPVQSTAPKPDYQFPDNLVPWDKPWRRPRVTHLKEELFVDIIETVRGVHKTNNYKQPETIQISGEIRLTTRLNDEPHVVIDMYMPVKHSQIQAHRCVDVKLLENSYEFSFCPPDATCCLARYNTTTRDAGPLSVSIMRKPEHFEVSLSTSIDVKVEHLDNLVVNIVFPQGVRNVKELSSTGGHLDVSAPQRCVYRLDPTVPMGWRAQLKAQAVNAAGEYVAPLYAEYVYNLVGRVPSATSVKRITITPQKFKKPTLPFKGVRYQTKVDGFIG